MPPARKLAYTPAGLPEGEELIGLLPAAKLVPFIRNGAGTTYQTMLRWGHKGCKAMDGRMVKMEMWKIGGQHVTTAKALWRFLRELNRKVDVDG